MTIPDATTRRREFLSFLDTYPDVCDLFLDTAIQSIMLSVALEGNNLELLTTCTGKLVVNGNAIAKRFDETGAVDPNSGWFSWFNNGQKDAE